MAASGGKDPASYLGAAGALVDAALARAATHLDQHNDHTADQHNDHVADQEDPS